jgi:alpha-mannosidase
MTVPKRNFIENLSEFLYRKDIIIRSINRKDIKRRLLGCSLPVGWKLQTSDPISEGEHNLRDQSIKIASIGQSHIDAAWKWRKEDTRIKKITVTFDRALAHMNMYPDFTYTQNQVIYYEWAKNYYPEMWQGIKKRIKEGKWEAVDGAWVEQDVNIPDGESLIRQRLIGQRFYLEEFGFMSDIAWMDDVFGFPLVLPQILAKTNAKYFLTNKFCYNEVNRFPYHTFIWKAEDGSEVLAYWMQHKNNWHKYLKTFRELSILMKDPQDHELNYMSDFDSLKTHIKDEFLPIIGNVYGEGDGGHGPRPLQVLEELCWQKDGFVKLMNMAQFFSLLEAYRNELPIWNDELYLENHQGTLTSIHMIKENNKTAEVLLHNLEYLNTLNVVAKGINYQPELTELWKIMLFCQFHDVLPGSSIPEVYRDCAKDYAYVYYGLTVFAMILMHIFNL